MSAEDLGRRLLGEVKTVGMDELMRDFKNLCDPTPESRFGIPPLDRLLHIFEVASLPPPQVQKEPQSDDWSSSPPRGLPEAKNVARKVLKSKGPIVEITSTTQGTGKTHLLYLVVSLAILPSTYAGFNLKGKGGATVVFDSDGRFEVEKLVQVMRQHIKLCYEESLSAWEEALQAATAEYCETHDREEDAALLPEPVQHRPKAIPEDEVETLIKSCLRHVHIFRPQSLTSLVSTLMSLQAYLFDRELHSSAHRPLHSIILDSASAFYWQTKAEEDNARLGITFDPAIGSDSSTDNSVSILEASQLKALHQKVVTLLRSLQSTFSCTILYTSWSTQVPDSNNPRNLQLRPYLAPPFFHFPILRLALSRASVPPFAPTMSVLEALHERGERQEVVEEGLFVASVDQYAVDGWDKGTKDALREGAGEFEFVIQGKGVWIKEDGT
ncbi:hypothetical protein K402DRAFT_461120 [Aulographum hederae CBS 113979]|uniref:DNA recombination and repair protein Rad51-like C-terminal domain-containing protein n=1 Tax=Aulographum hederae CBS 113979 TaxID=1176131 RepID=A0A6G1HA23_9PEZI|nr:hypothetical protein K402DRAFT_461120 [Aulographum hederae CBS 113979]